jgi:hypothetical protein
MFRNKDRKLLNFYVDNNINFYADNDIGITLFRGFGMGATGM